jgi:putative transcriptional regulator
MNSLKGHLLVATPRLLDPNFVRTVLLMLEHNEEGAAGVVLNRPTQATVSDIAEQVLDEAMEWDKAIYMGGPVTGPLMILHTDESLGDLNPLPGVFSTADAPKIEQMLRVRIEPSLVIANYAGWGPGQLESEIAEDSWLSLPARPEFVFWDGDAEDLWDAVVKEIHAGDLSRFLGLRDLPEDPSVN